MKLVGKYKLGSDITFTWTLLDHGEPMDLEGRSVSVECTDVFNREVPITYLIAGSDIVITVLGEDQTSYGLLIFQMLEDVEGTPRLIDVCSVELVHTGGSSSSGGGNVVQSDWAETNVNNAAYIKNKPTIPTSLSQLADDEEHRVVTDTEKAAWDAKSNFSGSYNDLTDKPTIPAAVQSNWNETDATSAAYIQNKPSLEGLSVYGGTAVSLKQDGSSRTLILKDTRSREVAGIIPSDDLSSAWAQGSDTNIPTLKLVKDKISGKLDNPSGGTVGQVLTKTADGVAWDDASGGIANETDPVFTDSPAHGITASDIAAWNSAAILGEDDGEATSLDFDPQADTVWNKAQTLSSAQQQQARANIGAAGVNDIVGIPIVNHGTSDKGTSSTSYSISPNTLHVWGEVDALYLSLTTGEVGYMQEYMIQFTSGSTATVLNLPSSIKWINNITPSDIEASTIYQVSILNGIGVIGGAV